MTGTSRSGGNREIGHDSTEFDGGPIRPKTLPPEIARKFDELMAQLPRHILRKIDVHELKLLSELLHLADQLGETVRLDPTDHKSGRLFMNCCDRIHRLSAAFGLNPTDRRRMQIPVDEGPDVFQQWLADAKGGDS